MNHFKIPLLNPLKFVPHTETFGIHFDDAWAFRQIRAFERKAYYRQKWVKTDTTPLQIESSIQPNDFIIINPAYETVKTIEWVLKFAAVDYSIYELVFDVSDLPDGVYFGVQVVEVSEDVRWPVITEPIHVKSVWPNTRAVTYKNSYNKFDVAFSTGIRFKFRCEWDIPGSEFTPTRSGSDYNNQVKNLELLEAVPGRQYNLLVGDGKCAAPYVIDLMNRILCCDSVLFENKQFAAPANAAWNINRAKGFPLVSGSIDLFPSQNETSLEFADTTPLPPGIILAYNFNTSIFAPGSVVPILEFKQNS